jgi:hypothetical protein
MKTCPKCNNEHSMNGKFCSPSCANSRSWTEEDKKKKSDSLKKTVEEHGHWCKGIKGWTPTEKDKQLKRQRSIEAWDRRGRKPALTDAEARAKNVSAVQAYRQRKYSATPVDVDRKLIQSIYENCPKGYEVDHIIALCNGGPHHQNNLQYLPSIVNRKKNRYQNYDKDSVLRWQDIIK